ncbi:MAG TPA: phosphoenolpyruvate--protein phosphotransferase [Balneolaceae bacterium]|nr:phosphoenolpyruvate--protein phosphotransferase [Balneolaceae bacterium]
MSKSNNHEFAISGTPGSPGIVIGKTSLYRRNRPIVSNFRVNDRGVKKQIAEFHEARDRAEKELKQMLEAQNDGSAEELIQTQIEMINDPELCERVESEISEHNQPADSAIQKVFEQYLSVMRQNHEEMYHERSVDIADTRDRLIQILHNHEADEVKQGTILVARELSPREVIEFSDRHIKGIIVDRGGTTSHAAIIARAMNIPMVVGLKNITKILNADKQIVLDGQTGEVIINPGESTLNKYQDLIDQQIQAETDFQAICEKPNVTQDNKPFVLRANIEFAEELSMIKKYKADGIGLLRTESIYLRQEHFGDQQKQQAFYQAIVEGTAPQPVIIRLFDAGGDKLLRGSKKEQNPFLGWRGIRMLLDNEGLLKDQLRAILKTAAEYEGCVRILIPMISTVDQLFQVRELMQSVQQELKDDGVDIDEQVQLGIMIEVPNVALQAEFFAKHADFLSIGTNDLTQYVLAVDRGNERISTLYDQRHPAVWNLINQVAEAGQKTDTPVSVCGELAADPISACCLMGLGINELSMSPTVLPTVKQRLRSRSLSDMKEFSKDVLACDTLDEINELFANWNATNTRADNG